MYNGNDVESGSFIEIDLILASPPGYFVCICCMRDSTFSLSFSCGMPVWPIRSVEVWPSLTLSIAVRRPVLISFFRSASFLIRTGISMLCFLKNIFPRMCDTWLSTLVSTMMKSCCVSSLRFNSYWSYSTFSCRTGKTVFTCQLKIIIILETLMWCLPTSKQFVNNNFLTYLCNIRFPQKFFPVIYCGFMVNFFTLL